MTSPTPGTPPVPGGRLVLLRHGETEWSRDGRHTGLTDLEMLPSGEQDARSVRPLLTEFDLVHVRCSPLARARRTAELAGLHPDVVDEDLREWDYGGYEGVSTAEIREQVGYPWTVFEHGVVPGRTPGETIEEVAARASRVLRDVVPMLHDGDVALVGHGHHLRILTGVYLRSDPMLGRHLELATGTVSVLGHHHEDPVVTAWSRRR
jgi:broad specificity phosphatase PhoE